VPKIQAQRLYYGNTSINNFNSIFTVRFILITHLEQAINIILVSYYSSCFFKQSLFIYA